MTKKSRKAFQVHAPHWPALEDQLEEFVLEQRAACRGLNTVQLRMKDNNWYKLADFVVIGLIRKNNQILLIVI
jgi:hypothetical protein